MLEPARRLPESDFIVAGPQYPDDIRWPANVERRVHLPPAEHRAFYNAQRFTLNITRADMIRAGYSPSVRLFEAAACGVPIISDWWDGLDTLFEPGPGDPRRPLPGRHDPLPPRDQRGRPTGHRPPRPQARAGRAHRRPPSRRAGGPRPRRPGGRPALSSLEHPTFSGLRSGREAGDSGDAGRELTWQPGGSRRTGRPGRAGLSFAERCRAPGVSV